MPVRTLATVTRTVEIKTYNWFNCSCVHNRLIIEVNFKKEDRETNAHTRNNTAWKNTWNSIRNSNETGPMCVKNEEFKAHKQTAHNQCVRLQESSVQRNKTNTSRSPATKLFSCFLFLSFSVRIDLDRCTLVCSCDSIDCITYFCCSGSLWTLISRRLSDDYVRHCGAETQITKHDEQLIVFRYFQ